MEILTFELDRSPIIEKHLLNVNISEIQSQHSYHLQLTVFLS
jgi:hypothetical protein